MDSHLANAEHLAHRGQLRINGRSPRFESAMINGTTRMKKQAKL
jgi:hypothetical protein